MNNCVKISLQSDPVIVKAVRNFPDNDCHDITETDASRNEQFQSLSPGINISGKQKLSYNPVVNPYAKKRLRPSQTNSVQVSVSSQEIVTSQYVTCKTTESHVEIESGNSFVGVVAQGTESATCNAAFLTSPIVNRNPYLSKRLNDTSSSTPNNTHAVGKSEPMEGNYTDNSSLDLKANTPELIKSNSKGTIPTNKFIGGAERARQLARKKVLNGPAKRIMRPGESEKKNSNDFLPLRMNSMERFFAALLRSSPMEYYDSEKSDQKALVLWEKVCKRVGITVPTAPIHSVYDSKKVHFDVRAALVLEESRAILSQCLERSWGNNSRRGPKFPMILTAHIMDRRNSSCHPQITFHSSQNFTKDDLFHIRPGSVFQCIPRESERVIQNVQLGVVLTSNRDQVEKQKKFACMFFRADAMPFQIENTEWIASPLCPLVTELRAFDAMTNNPGDVSFCADLMGKQRARHTRFLSVDEDEKVTTKQSLSVENDILMVDSVSSDDDVSLTIDRQGSATIDCDPSDGDDFLLFQEVLDAATKGAMVGEIENVENSSPNVLSKGALSLPTIKSNFSLLNSQYFNISGLNESQEKAASSFLNSENGTITLIQGPPGTGKTTLLVSVICRYLSENSGSENKRRLMVCAPTNKAVSVLATRFMKAYKESSYGFFNSILVGDADKLLADVRSKDLPNKYDNIGELKSIFLYSWMPNFVEDYKKIKEVFVPGGKVRRNLDSLHLLSTQLEHRLLNSIPDISTEIKTLTARISTTLKKLRRSFLDHDIIKDLDALIKLLLDIPQDTVWTQLMLSANVIFCTLASAGGSVLKKTAPIHDLIVDEAAAATEPELCIPFHLKPTRLLAVGDPLQLPATVISRKATQLGLTKSLHERLMYDCNFEHVMLDTQYRMNPAISDFPSSRFYNSKIANGANVRTAEYTKGPRLLDRRPYTFLQVDGLEEQSGTGSYNNRVEALKIVELVTTLRRIASPQDPSWHSSDRIRIITFYQAQVLLIKRLLQGHGLAEKIVVATVDSSQGCEADIVLISFVRSQLDSSKRHAAGFLTDDRRMNVALTRAKYQLICVGNIRSFEKMADAETMHMLSVDAKKRGVVRPKQDVGLVGKDTNEHLTFFYTEASDGFDRRKMRLRS